MNNRYLSDISDPPKGTIKDARKASWKGKHKKTMPGILFKLGTTTPMNSMRLQRIYADLNDLYQNEEALPTSTVFHAFRKQEQRSIIKATAVSRLP